MSPAGLFNTCAQLQEPELLMEPAGDSERTISLLILWRCLGNFNAEASPKAVESVEKLWAWFPAALQQRLSSELLWQAFERLARTAPGGGAVSAVSQVVEAARQTLSDVSLPSGCQHSCLRALHALVTFTREPLAPLFNDEMQQLLVARCHHLDVPGSSASVRSVLGILGNLAYCSQSFCQELSGVGIVRPFSLALAKSLSWYKEQLSESETLEVEVHLSYAMASLLLGWLARGSSMARGHLGDQLGSTQALLDILRTFTIFQDRCGILTDGSLLCVHTVMQFLAEAEAEQLQQGSKAESPRSRDGKEEDLTCESPKGSKTGHGQMNLRELTSEERANLLQMELTPEHGKIFRQMEMTPPCPKTSERKASWKERELTQHHPKTSECEGALREMELTPPRPKTSKRKAALTQEELTPPHPKPSKTKAALKQMELTPQHSKTSECKAPSREMEQSFCTDVVQVYQRRRAKRREDDVSECGDFNPVPL